VYEDDNSIPSSTSDLSNSVNENITNDSITAPQAHKASQAEHEHEPLLGWYDPYDGTYHYNSPQIDTVQRPKEDKRWPSVKAAGFFFLIILGAQTVLSSLYATVSAFFESVPSGLLYTVTCIISLVSLGVPLLIYLKKYGDAKKDLLRLHSPSPSTLAVVGVISILAFFVNFAITESWIYLVSLIGTPIITDTPNPTSIPGIIMMVLSLCVIAPVLEELCFRGVLQRGLEGKGAKYSIIMCGVLFALMHMSVTTAPPKIILGIILAYTAYATNSLWCPIIIHAVNNIASVVMSFMPADPNAPTLEEMLDIPVLDKISLALVYFAVAAIGTVIIFLLISLLGKINSGAPRHRYRTDLELYGQGKTQTLGIKIGVIIIILNMVTEIGLMIVNDLNLLDYLLM